MQSANARAEGANPAPEDARSRFTGPMLASLGMRQRESQRDRRAHRQATNYGGLRTSLVEQPGDVGDETVAGVLLRLGRRTTARVAASIVQHDAIVLPERATLRAKVTRAATEAVA